MPDQNTNNYKFRETEISVRELFHIIMRSKWLVISVTTIMVIIGIFITIWQMPVYQSHAMLVVDQEESSFSIFNLGLDASGVNIADDIQLLKSRTLIESSLSDLWASGGGLDLFLFGTKKYSPVGIKRAVREIFTLGLWNNQVAIGDNLTNSQLDSLINKASKYIQKELSISNPKGSNIINVHFDSYDPHEAALIINSILGSFINREQQWNSGEGTHMRGFLEEQISNLANELNAVEEELKDYQEQEKIFGLEDEAGIVMRELASIETAYYSRLAAANIAREKRRYLLGRISEADTTLAIKLVNSVNNQLVALRQEIASSEANLVRNSSLYGESHEAVLSTKEKIRKLKMQLTAQTWELLAQGLNVSDPLEFRQALVDSVLSLEGTVLGLEGAASEYKNLLDQYTGQLNSFPEKSLRYFRLEREQFVLSETYKFLRQKLEEARLNEASALSKIRIVDPAIPIYKPIKPNPVSNILLFFIFGAIIGSGIALWKERDYSSSKK